jgi:hypothetical protein
MRTLLTTTVLVVCSAPALKAQDQSDPRAVIDRAIEAAGGEEILAKNKAHTWNETGTFYGMGDGLPFKAAYASQLPDQFKMAVENVFTVVLDGNKGWVNDNEMSAEQLAELKETNYAGWVSTLLPLKDKAFTLTAIEGIKIGEETAIGIKINRSGHRDVKLYFNKANGLLAKVVARAKPEELGGKEVDQETELRDYKDINGMKVPMKVVIQRDGKRFVEATIQDWKGTEKMDKSVFAKP